MERQYAKYGYLFIAPFFIVFAIFSIYPIFYTLFGKYVTAYKKGDSGAETLSEAFNSFYTELELTYNDIYKASGLSFQD